ncbi:MAG TPA: glycosyl hydrolase family 18 protein [Candidatus Limnocylindrales bacterium]|nr:glycosyl hydrolase family 18 protein [Candidatus Limnocylindrales bacterium]
MSGSVEHRRVPKATVPALAAVLLAGLLPLSPVTAADPQPGRAAGALDGPEPSIIYEEAMAHEGDRIAFEPGGLVETGFTPRVSDRWPVDGGAPTALPGGRATGRQMAASANGSRWTEITVPGTSAAAPDVPASEGGTAAPVDPTRPETPTPTPTPDPATVTPAPSDAPVDAPADEPSPAPADGAALVDPAPDTFDLAAASGLRRQVFGFLPYWEVSGASTRLNYDVLSTIAYFSVGASSNGNLKKKDADGTNTTGWGGWTSAAMTNVINAAHQRGTRVVLTVSVFAWTSGQASVQKAILGSPTARLNLARQAAAAVRDRGADGINLDFEPLASGYADEFTAFLKTVRSELNRIKRGYQLTYDTTGFIGNYPLEASVGAGAADAVFVMGYDYRTSGSGTAGSIDPLSGPKYDLADTVRAYTARIPASRVILGLPWYGRAWSTETDDARSATLPGAKYGYSTAVNYGTVTGLVEKHGRRWDPAEQSPYVAYRRENCTSSYGCVTSWRQVYYDDFGSLKARLGMVNDYGLRGAGVWALGYDGGHPELYRAFAESFLVDKSAPQAGVRILASAQPDEGFVVTWAAKDTSAVVSYDVQVSTDGGAWATWLANTTATSDVWLGRDGTGYAFRVRARDSKGNTGAFNIVSVFDASPALAPGGFGRVVTDGLSYRTGPGTGAASLGSLDSGTIVAVTRGPVSADGYSWYEVTQPIREWNPVTFVERGVWVAASSSTTTHVAAYRAPNATLVNAGMVGLDFATGTPSAVGSGPTAANLRRFSPNGDGSRDVMRLRWTNTVALDTLALKVFRSDGTYVGAVAVGDNGTGARTWDWNGTVGGVRVRDGRYVLQLRGTAGGATYSAPSGRPVTAAQVAAYGVVVDTVPPVVSAASATFGLISPNGDGTRDSTKLTLTATGAARWTARVTSTAGTTVRTVSGTGGNAALTWGGMNDAGTRVPDGRYAIALAALDEAGNPAVRTWSVVVDTVGPAIAPSVSPGRFSPDGDGAADTTVLRWTANEKATGTARIWKGTTLIRSWSVTALTAWSVTWNGRTARGTLVKDGRYTLKVSGRDAAGNARTAAIPVVVDRTVGGLRWSSNLFPQDGDALRPSAALTWRLSRSATTTLRVFDADGTLVRTAWTGRVLASGARGWRWDGRKADGTLVPQGRYTASLTVTSSLGTQELARSVWAAGFAITPSATTVRAGQTLTVRISTVEPLATRPVVTFVQPGRAGVKVTATRLADGTYRATFRVAAGSAGSAGVRVSATDIGGHANTTSIPITIAAS